MNLPAQPRLARWPFLAGDAVLLATAFAVGYYNPTPLSAAALSVVFGCVALGCVLAAIPYLSDYAAGQREFEVTLLTKLGEQNTKLAHAAEILTGAAGQLKSAHEAAHRMLHTAETLPYRMQEKVGEFTAQLQEHEDGEKAAMEKELEALRETEGERLTVMADKIRASTKDLLSIEKETRPVLEAALRQSGELAKALTGATAKAHSVLAEAEAKLQRACEAASARTQEVAETAGRVEERLGSRVAELRQLESELDAALGKRLEQLKAATKAVEAGPMPRTSRRESERNSPAKPVESAPVAASDEASAAAVPSAESPPHPMSPVVQLTAFAGRVRPDPVNAPAEDPVAVVSSVATDAPAKDAAAEPPPVPELPPKREPRRKSTARNLGEAVLPGFADQRVVYDEGPAAAPAAPAKTSDGTTRLLVTAYIGIGNRVFLRGEGPGLNREKGVPMEFVSIGKWAWQTAEATEPVKVLLYKNDEVRAQGEEVVLPPGHHVEAMPVFHEPDPF